MASQDLDFTASAADVKNRRLTVSILSAAVGQSAGETLNISMPTDFPVSAWMIHLGIQQAAGSATRQAMTSEDGFYQALLREGNILWETISPAFDAFGALPGANIDRKVILPMELRKDDILRIGCPVIDTNVSPTGTWRVSAILYVTQYD